MSKEVLLLEKLDEINTVLKENHQTEDDIGVLSGISGIAIFQFYYSKLKQDEASADLGADLLSTVVEQINNGYDQPTYCSGIAGAGWAMELLSEEGFIDLDCDELLPLLDDFLVEFLNIDEQENFYDFLHGILGVGYYFYKRYQNTKSQQLREKYQQILSIVIEKLENASIHEGDTSKWESYLDRKEKLRGYNLSLAHGMSSILNFLSRLASEQYFYPLVEGLLKQTVNYILSHEGKEVSESSQFPDWVFLNQEVNQSGRLAWCYGDLGLAISLWQTGNVLKDKDLSNKALNILKRTTKRTTPEDTKVVDAGICHGAAGLMQIYNYMYKQTQDNDFKDATEFWMEQTLAFATHEKGYAGYMQKRGDDKEPWKAELSLLEGVAGIGLAIISYLKPTETKWDQCLLIS